MGFYLCLVIAYLSASLLWLERLSVLEFHRLVELTGQWVPTWWINLLRSHHAGAGRELRSLAFLSGCKRRYVTGLVSAGKWLPGLVQVIGSSHLVWSWYLTWIVLLSQLHYLLVNFYWNLFELVWQFLPFLVACELLSSGGLTSAFQIDGSFWMLFAVRSQRSLGFWNAVAVDGSSRDIVTWC